MTDDDSFDAGAHRVKQTLEIVRLKQRVEKLEAIVEALMQGAARVIENLDNAAPPIREAGLNLLDQLADWKRQRDNNASNS